MSNKRMGSLGVLPLKMTKVNKEDLYITLTHMYGWHPDIIADMNPYQQLIYLRGPRTVKFGTMEEYQAWQKNRGK